MAGWCTSLVKGLTQQRLSNRPKTCVRYRFLNTMMISYTVHYIAFVWHFSVDRPSTAKVTSCGYLSCGLLYIILVFKHDFQFPFLSYTQTEWIASGKLLSL